MRESVGGAIEIEPSAIDLDLLLEGIESAVTPKICGLGIIDRIRVESFVGWHVFIELMDEQEDGLELTRISHERVQRGVGIIFSEA